MEVQDFGNQIILHQEILFKTVNLGGILTLGMVAQENGTHLINRGTITDVEEKNSSYIQNLGTSTHTIHGPGSEVYSVVRTQDGYVGYKIGIAQVEENGGVHDNNMGKDNQKLTNSNLIDFRGNNSIGMYVFLDM